MKLDQRDGAMGEGFGRPYFFYCMMSCAVSMAISIGRLYKILILFDMGLSELGERAPLSPSTLKQPTEYISLLIMTRG